MRAVCIFALLVFLKTLVRLFYRLKVEWIGEAPPGISETDRWRGHRVAAILNHTSLFDWLWVTAPPLHFLWQVARHGVVPVADVTIRRPIIGFFFKLVAQHVVSISRERDRTWQEVLEKIDDDQSLVILLPEGRMMRRDGLDKKGNPMTVRGGIADLLEGVREGRLLLAYSRGLHHVQVPDEGLPRLFQTIELALESIDVPTYLAARETERKERSLKRAIVRDLERRRDLHCWPDPSKHPRPEALRPSSEGAAKAGAEAEGA